MAARRAVNQSRRLPDSASIPLVSSLHPKSRNTPLLSVGLVILGAFLLVGYSYSSSGPDTCAVVSTLLKEDDTEAWGVEPYDLEDADSSCKRLVRKGVVRSADIKFSLPYRPKSFSVVIVSDALDYLSPKYLNKTLPDLARVSSDGLVIFAGNFVSYANLVSREPRLRSLQNLGNRAEGKGEGEPSPMATDFSSIRRLFRSVRGNFFYELDFAFHFPCF
ncbi:hypothetical protein BHM03_00056647 [Ensete ventricosum]|nr:hypothetical protein BHM03_00056647 [Ensete ventricosum]